MKIVKISVVKQGGTSTVYFYTDLPPVISVEDNINMILKSEMNSSIVESYLAEHFSGIEIESFLRLS